MASAPGGLLYVDDAARGLLELGPEGASRRISASPCSAPLALASDGTALLLGCDGSLFASPDGGSHWTRQPVPAGHFSAVTRRGPSEAAGAWGARLWTTTNDGATWSASTTPAADVEVDALLINPSGWYAAGLTGLLRSDNGRTWVAVPGLNSRLTSLAANNGSLLAGSWHGELFAGSDAAWHLQRRLPAGIWAVAPPDAIATATGLVVGQAAGPSPLDRVEVVNLAPGAGGLFAAAAGGTIYWAPVGASAARLLLEG